MTTPVTATGTTTTGTPVTITTPVTMPNGNVGTVTTTTAPQGVQPTAAPAQAPAASPAAPAAPAATPAAPDAAEADSGLPDDPEALKVEIARLRRENAGARTTAKANAAEQARTEFAQEVGKALGLINADEPVDPVKLTAQLTEQTGAAQQAQRELAVYRLAATAGADPALVLDSHSFRESFKSIDPNDSNAVTEAIKAAITANPSLAVQATRRVPAPSPAVGSSANGAPDLEALIADAQKRGDLMGVVRLQNQKLAALQQR